MTIIDLSRVTEVAEDVREEDVRTRHIEHAISLTRRRRCATHLEMRLAATLANDVQNPFGTELDKESKAIMAELEELHVEAVRAAELKELNDLMGACACIDLADDEIKALLGTTFASVEELRYYEQSIGV